jgi:glyceraldehyde 3-phosphate dehydrogenase
VLGVTDEPLVSTDFNGDLHSATVDLSSTQVVGDLVKVLAWYDNEMAYATRLYEMAKFVAGKAGA